jgi:hypothetical protein
MGVGGLSPSSAERGVGKGGHNLIEMVRGKEYPFCESSFALLD